MDNTSLQKLIDTALEIEAQDAREAGALGFMARALVLATMPHSKPLTNEFERYNGLFTLSMIAPSRIGLPYGSVPRLLSIWITIEALRTKERRLLLGDGLSDFMRQLHMVPTGGRWGTITRLRQQAHKLFMTTISCDFSRLEAGHRSLGGGGFRVADEHLLWWSPQAPEQESLFESHVQLTQPFFDEIVRSPVPIDMRAVEVLRKSPLALDIYLWLTYRYSYLRVARTIPWGALQLQFGSSYANTPQGRRDFKRAFVRELKKVVTIYGRARLEVRPLGLHLKPSRTHIPPLPGFQLPSSPYVPA